MKKILFVIITFLVLAGNVFAEMPKFKAGTYDPKGQLLLVTMKGLICDFCAKSLEKTFMKQKEVAGVDINLTTKVMMISLKEGKNIDDQTVDKLVEKSAGYNVSEITRKEAGQHETDQ